MCVQGNTTDLLISFVDQGSKQDTSQRLLRNLSMFIFGYL